MSQGAATVAPRPAWMAGELPAPIRTLVAVKRAGTLRSRRTVWLMRCTVCTTEITISSAQLANGKACCPECVPNVARAQEKAILAMLPAAQPEIMEKLGMTKAMTNWRTMRMRKQGLMHVGDWKRTESVDGSYQPIFHASKGKDVPCPFVPLSNKDRTQRYVKKMKSTEEGRDKMETRRARTRALYHAAKARKTGDPLVAALFGRRPAGASHDQG